MGQENTALYAFGGMNAVIAVNLSVYTIAFLALMLFAQIPHINESAEGENETLPESAKAGLKSLKQNRNEDKLIIHFELGGWNLTDELKKRMNALIKASKKKVDEFRYKRIYFKDIKLSQDDYDESLRNVTNFY